MLLYTRSPSFIWNTSPNCEMFKLAPFSKDVRRRCTRLGWCPMISQLSTGNLARLFLLPLFKIIQCQCLHGLLLPVVVLLWVSSSTKLRLYFDVKRQPRVGFISSGQALRIAWIISLVCWFILIWKIVCFHFWKDTILWVSYCFLSKSSLIRRNSFATCLVALVSPNTFDRTSVITIRTTLIIKPVFISLRQSWLRSYLPTQEANMVSQKHCIHYRVLELLR